MAQGGAREPLTPSQKRFKRRSWIIGWIAAAIFLVVILLLDPVMHRPKRLDDLLALIGGFLMLQMALVMAVSHFMAPAEMPRQRLSQVLTPVTSGAAVILPLIGPDLIDPRLNFAIVIALVALSFWLAWRVWRTADELHRAIVRDSYMVNYFVLATALWFYATGERLGLFSAATSWGWLAFAVIITLPCSLWVSYRRGLDLPPKDD
ncbi:MAG TPA: hypothetical protein VGO52_23495 [Hyphomonadaceae bacterium]|jgi:hypothetical protein|nr:hypothetical protein [Hyphomonadaceae bacterium]